MSASTCLHIRTSWLKIKCAIRKKKSGVSNDRILLAWPTDLMNRAEKICINDPGTLIRPSTKHAIRMWYMYEYYEHPIWNRRLQMPPNTLNLPLFCAYYRPLRPLVNVNKPSSLTKIYCPEIYNASCLCVPTNIPPSYTTVHHRSIYLFSIIHTAQGLG